MGGLALTKNNIQIPLNGNRRYYGQGYFNDILDYLYSSMVLNGILNYH